MRVYIRHIVTMTTMIMVNMIIVLDSFTFTAISLKTFSGFSSFNPSLCLLCQSSISERSVRVGRRMRDVGFYRGEGGNILI